MFSHRIHGIHRTDWQRVSSHRFHRFTQMLCFWSSVNSVYSVGLPTPPVNLCKSVQSVGGLFWLRGVYPPTKQTGRDVLPQNSRNSQNRLAEGVLPQNSRNSQNRLAEDVLPQNSRNSQNSLAEMFSHRFHRLSQMVCVWNSVNSVCSVGPPTPPVNLCKSAFYVNIQMF